jgi:hypothetical protein
MHTTHACTMVLVLDLASPKAGIGAPAAGFYFHWNKFLRDRVWAVVSNPMIAGDRARRRLSLETWRRALLMESPAGRAAHLGF